MLYIFVENNVWKYFLQHICGVYATRKFFKNNICGKNSAKKYNSIPMCHKILAHHTLNFFFFGSFIAEIEMHNCPFATLTLTKTF